MKYSVSMVLFAVLFSVISINAQDQQTTSPNADEMKAWQEYMAPGEPHKLMADCVGDWTFKMKMWMDPSAEPQTYEGTSTSEMILGGRYLRTISKSVMMEMPFEGQMIEGYDNKTKEYTSVWIDNFGTGVAISKGTYDPATKSYTMVGTYIDPMTGQPVKNKQITTIVDKDHQKMEYFMEDKTGKEFKTMEIESTRK